MSLLTKKRKLFDKALNSPRNFQFDDFVTLLGHFGFVLERISGSYRIYSQPDALDSLVIQPAKGKAKPYQIKQFLKLVEEYNLLMSNAEDDE